MRSIGGMLHRFHEDQGGAEGLEKLLIIAAIVLPLLGVLIIFRNKLGEWVNTLWDQVTGAGQQPVP